MVAERDVLVTGLGCVTPLGGDLDRTWGAALDGESGAGRLTRFDPGDYGLRSTLACEVDGDVADHERVDDRSMGRFTRLGVVAADEAVADAGLDPESWAGDRVGTSVATGFGGTPTYEAGVERVEAGDRVSPRFLVSYLPNMAAGHLSIEFDARGPNRASTAACAAGAQAIADAVDDVREGRADVSLAGGAESCLTPTAMVGFDAMRALSTRNDDPTGASRPFDADRDGFVIAEGAAVLVLEAREHAEQRGAAADAYAETAGVGLAGDAAHPTRPPADAHGLRRAMTAAADAAGVDRVDCVDAHATSTRRGDTHEATAVDALGDDPLVWAPKSALGHALGAAGAVETALGARAVATGTVPPTLNHETPDTDCPVTVRTRPVDLDPDALLCNAAGFGGTNVSICLTPA
ncbi:beta-ketoacyl synthase [Halobacteriales archaeon SW_5_70_135]|nr:MAG: beta-ketoacyl synthase [Halobacteriales archaeon SW_5_70_135]